MLRLISSFYCCVRNFYRHSGFKQRIFIISQFLRVRGPGWSSVQALTRLPSRCWLMAFSSGGSTEENPLPSALRLLKAFPCCYVTDDPEFLLAINWRAPSDSRGVHVPKWVRSATWVFSESIWTAITRYYRVGGWAVQFSSVQSLRCVRLFVSSWTSACPDSLSIINSRSLFKLTSIESVMPSNLLR